MHPVIPEFSLFKSLRSFTWHGAGNPLDAIALTQCLQACAESLEDLTVAVCSSCAMFFSSKAPPFVLTRLTRLKLIGANFGDHAAADVIRTLCIPSLQSLRLEACQAVSNLLERLMELDQTMAWTTLEIVQRHSGSRRSKAANRSVARAVPLVLEETPSLTQLFLSLHLIAKESWYQICHASRGLQELRQLSLHHHHRTIPTEQGPNFSHTIAWRLPVPVWLRSAARNGHLECLGIDGDPLKLVSGQPVISPTWHPSGKLTGLEQMEILGKLAPPSRCRLLHVRNGGPSGEHETLEATWPWEGRSSVPTHHQYPTPAMANCVDNLTPELEAFAAWAFGETGLPELRVLARGDFSHDGRFAASQVLLCRREPTAAHPRPFRHVAADDRALRNYVQSRMDFLEACPGESLFPSVHGYDHKDDGVAYHNISEDEGEGGDISELEDEDE